MGLRKRDYTTECNKTKLTYFKICGLAKVSRSCPSLKNPATINVPPKDLVNAHTSEGFPWWSCDPSAGSPDAVCRTSTLSGWYSSSLTEARPNVTLYATKSDST